jgi:two-component system cell cycle sensor histidine kinase/response regulator CckA
VTRPTVLIVEDEPAILAMSRMLLEREGYQVLTAEDGPTAVARFQSQVVDVVVLDLNIPGLGGWAVLAELRRLKPGARVIVSTGNAIHDDHPESHEVPTAVLPKPFRPSDLVEVVACVFAAPA